MRKGHDRDVGTITTDLESAKAALDRIAIPQDTVDRIAEMVSPRSSLIISDEALSSETGNGTEFVVVMSDEPQGGLKHRRPSPQIEVRYDRPGAPYWRSPIGGQYSPWGPRFSEPAIIFIVADASKPRAYLQPAPEKIRCSMASRRATSACGP